MTRAMVCGIAALALSACFPEWKGDSMESWIVVGRIAPIPHQHMIKQVPGKKHVYIDDQEGGQIVAYVRGTIDCPNRVKLTGFVLQLDGESKRGDGKKMSEKQLDVTSWECLPDLPGAAHD